MNLFEHWDWFLDGWILVAGTLGAVAAALLGNFLVLRRMSLLGDAISHAVLPGLAAAFFISGTRDSLPMFLGAVFVGVLTTLLIEWLRGRGKVDEGAAMGVVFTSLFALGLIMIVQAADRVDLDPGCVLYGAIELSPLDTWWIGSYEVPRVVVILGAVCLLNLIFVVAFFKELKVTSFDPGLATASGISAPWMQYALTTLVAVTAVASFESVGNILVVAMFVAPPAAAYMLTDRLGVMVLLSAIIAVAAAISGHISALTVPTWFGYRSTSTAGMMAVAAGLIFLLAAVFAPKHGVLMRWLRQRQLSWRILREDLLALLYRSEEGNRAYGSDFASLQAFLMTSRMTTQRLIREQLRQGNVMTNSNGYRLTEQGQRVAQEVVRSHRLWEQYLVSEAGVATERIHEHAERLEHYTDASLRKRLSEQMDSPEQDPHGSRIPPEH